MKAKEGGIKTHSKALNAMPETGFGRGRRFGRQEKARLQNQAKGKGQRCE
jgi:hypothetical protein